MKLAFSTLGCPAWDLDMILRNAAHMGFDGVELRGLGQTLDITSLPEFTRDREMTRRKFADAGIDVVCLSSSVRMSEPDGKKRAEHLDELKRYAELCAVFGTPNIRVFGGEVGEQPWEQAIDEAAGTLEKMIVAISDFPARIIVETHDDWQKGAHFHQLMKLVNSDKAGILWDVNHPFMFIGEDPFETWAQAGPWIHHTHWKDSKIVVDTVMGFEPCLMGEGDLPHDMIYEVLRRGGYAGYLSLEWEKRWHPDLPDPEIAFPQFIQYMKKLMAV
ncbi:MAG: sugar phosphate isomerase/epimerase family protein [Candidatus Zhuqueibacterota bacterium]